MCGNSPGCEAQDLHNQFSGMPSEKTDASVSQVVLALCTFLSASMNVSIQPIFRLVDLMLPFVLGR